MNLSPLNMFVETLSLIVGIGYVCMASNKLLNAILKKKMVRKRWS